MEKNTQKEDKLIEYNEYYNIGNNYIKIGYNDNEFIINYYNTISLDGIKFVSKTIINEIQNKHECLRKCTNMKDIYNIIKIFIEDGKYKVINENNNSNIIIDINGIAVELQLLKNEVIIDKEYLNIISNEINKIKNNYNNEIKLLKEENNSLKNIIKNLQNNNNIINNNNNDDEKNKLTLTEFNKKFSLDLENNDITELDLSYKNIKNDISYLASINFDQIIRLDLGSNSICDISILSKLKYDKLQILYLDNNCISDINVFEKANFPLIEEIDLSKNKINDISVLSKVNFNKLKELYLCDNSISNIDVLEKVKFKDIEKLNFSNNKIEDINVFTKITFTKLKLLYLKNNNIDLKKYESLINDFKSKKISFNI